MRRTQAGLLGYRVVITASDAVYHEAKLLSGRGADVARVCLAGPEAQRAEDELVSGLLALARAAARSRPLVALSTGFALQAWMRSAAASDSVAELLEVLERAELLVTPAAVPAVRACGLEHHEVVLGEGPIGLAAAVGQRRPGTVFMARHTPGPSSPAEQLRRSGWRVVDLPVPMAGHGAGAATDGEVAGLVRSLARRVIDGVSLASVVGLDRLLDQARALGLLDEVLDASRHHVSCTAADPRVANAAQAWGLHVAGVARSGRAQARVDALGRSVALRRRLLCADPFSVVLQGCVVIVDGTALWMSGPARRVVEAIATGQGQPVAPAALARAVAGSEFHPSAGSGALSAAVTEAAERLAVAGVALVPSGPGVVLGRRTG